MRSYFGNRVGPQGVSVETICRAIRGLTVLRELSNEATLVVLCDLKFDQADAVEVTVVNITSR